MMSLSRGVVATFICSVLGSVSNGVGSIGEVRILLFVF